MTPDMAAMGGTSGGPDLSLLQVAVYAFLGLMVVVFLLVMLAIASLPIFFAGLSLLDLGLKASSNFPDPIGKTSKIGGLVFRSLRRNLLRTALTYVALFVLTGMLTFIYGMVTFLGDFTADKDGAQMVILTEKFSIPSQMPPGYATQLKTALLDMPKDKIPRPMTDAERTKLALPLRPDQSITAEEVAKYFNDKPDSDFSDADVSRRQQLVKLALKDNMMTWSFVGGTLDITKITKENSLFFFALDPDAIVNGMMSEQGLKEEELGKDQWAELLRVMEIVKEDKRCVVIGDDKLKLLNKKVGDEIRITSTNYKDIEFEMKIVGAFPSGTRLSTSACMRYDYLLSKLDEYKTKKGEDHPIYAKCLNLVWVRMPDKPSFEYLSGVVNQGSKFSAPAAKIETFSAAVGAFLDPYKDIFWGLKFIVMPAIVAIMCLVIGITITIGVRERWTEMAVMKVLGFQPWQIMGMIISEAMLIGVFSGLLSTWSVFFLPKAISWFVRTIGVKFAFFDNFNMPPIILLGGPVLGLFVAMIGAALPSWNARKVRVSEVFAQVA